MNRTLIILSACSVLMASLSGCSWFRRSGDVDAYANSSSYNTDYSTPVPATTPVYTAPAATYTAAPVATVPSNNAMIDTIKVYRNPVSQEQLIVEVTGSVPNGCSQVGDVDYRVVGNTFKYALPLVNTSNGAICTQALVPFSKKMGLNAAGQPLATGSYNVEVNGNVQPFNI